jgi:ATP-dependent Clp protease adaptor protein ClpS
MRGHGAVSAGAPGADIATSILQHAGRSRCPGSPIPLKSPLMAERREQGDVKVVERTQTTEKLARPNRWKVLLHNDDYTTMEFVVWVLQFVFHHDETTATQIMLHVHRTGIGVAGVYSREVAETRVAQVEALAREHEFPLRSSMEEA